MRLPKSCLTEICDKAATLAGALIIAMVVVQLVIVVLRYVFFFGVTWGLDLLVYLFLISSLLPLFLVVLENRSVRVDVLYQGYPSILKAVVDRVGLAVLLFPVMAYTAYVSFAPTLNSWKLLESSPTLGGLPGYFLLKTVMLITFSGLTLIAFILVLRSRPWDYTQKSEKGDDD